MLRREAVVAIGGLLAGKAARAQSSTYPSKPIRLVIPFPAGGGSDMVGRVMADKLSARLGQPLVIINAPGAGGMIATQQVATSAADGHTLFYANASTLTISPQLLRKGTSPPWTSFVAVAPVAEFFNVLVTHPSVPVSSFKELVAYGRAHPGKLVYGSPGIGTTPHLLGELLSRDAGLQMTHVPYRGAGPEITDMLSGGLSLIFDQPATIVPFVVRGQLKALAVAGDRRVDVLPGVPTMAELGMPGLVIQSWSGVVAPIGTDPAIVTRLNREIADVMALPPVLEALTQRGFVPMRSTPNQFDAMIRSEYARWGSLIKARNIVAE